MLAETLNFSPLERDPAADTIHRMAFENVSTYSEFLEKKDKSSDFLFD